MRKTIAVLITGGCLLLGLAAASPALAKTRPAPIQLLCSASANGGTLVNGVCVLPAGVAGGANTYYGIIAVSNPNGGDTFQVISGTVPPGLTVLPQYGSGTIVTGTPTQAGTFVFTVQATSPQGATAALACGRHRCPVAAGSYAALPALPHELPALAGCRTRHAGVEGQS